MLFLFESNVNFFKDFAHADLEKEPKKQYSKREYKFCCSAVFSEDNLSPSPPIPPYLVSIYKLCVPPGTFNKNKDTLYKVPIYIKLCL